MKNAYILGLAEAALSLGAGYYFAGKSWETGAALLFITLLLLLRSGARIKKEDIDFVRAKDRASDAFVLAGITLGVMQYFAFGLLAIFSALILPQIAGRARQFRGRDARDITRKYRLAAIILAAVSQAIYPAAMVLGLIAVTVAVAFDFIGAIKGISRKSPIECES